MLAAKEEITNTDKESATEFNQLSVANEISEDDECWFKHPENCDDPSKLTGVFSGFTIALSNVIEDGSRPDQR